MGTAVTLETKDSIAWWIETTFYDGKAQILYADIGSVFKTSFFFFFNKLITLLQRDSSCRWRDVDACSPGFTESATSASAYVCVCRGRRRWGGKRKLNNYWITWARSPFLETPFVLSAAGSHSVDLLYPNHTQSYKHFTDKSFSLLKSHKSIVHSASLFHFHDHPNA